MGKRAVGRPKTPLSVLKSRGSRYYKTRAAELAEAAAQRVCEPDWDLDSPPDGLDEQAAAFWTSHARDLWEKGKLTPDTLAAFSVLCSAWSTYWGTTGREKAIGFTDFVQLAGKFGLTPER